MSSIAPHPTPEQIAQFRADGFLVLDNLISVDDAGKIAARFEKCFAGEFDTGIYPDEWHWRKGMSLPNITREICNAWKSDTTIASYILASGLGRLACELMGWEAARIGQDDLLYKPPGASAVGFHQDSEYISKQFVPYTDNSCTLWIALDDADPDSGSLEYMKGSHRWADRSNDEAKALDTTAFHQSEDYHKAGYEAAERSGIRNVEVVPTRVRVGGVAIHHQDTWHGSGPNTTTDRPRRALVAHILRADVKFKETGVGYIYGRYKKHGQTHVDEDFFPITYASESSGLKRSPFLHDLVQDALLPEERIPRM
eukprot:TRINITY_DN3022_c0_g1::TRINITY_DN3022_c0_g1_i1::g.22280::m.22280 TRINITY_DN3022_c0_g1::TRINITY_DN3022_c0_g1_i1::g.22280  ORF type:complete len:334 (+),score=21.04,sp/O69060/HTXA_PSEST/24.27/5e-09,PhyH/PF05721.8/1.9e-23 TRINITY_DN3022_c0_g1_i1:67-1002(+)